MAGPNQMVSGFNHNVKHHGQAYHVQTEDSGLGNPRIVTHLFVGGNVLASKKTIYGELAGAEGLEEIVRALMEDQHKEVLRNLISGVYDHVDAAYHARSYQPGQLSGDGAPAGPPPPAAASHGPPPPLPAPAGSAPAAAPAPGVPIPSLFDPAPWGAPAATGVPIPSLFDPTPVGAPGAGPDFPFSPQFDPEAVELSVDAIPLLPEEAVEAIFGEDGLSAKTLDEVILSYLVEDAEVRKP
jgi:hypothetical protein